MLHVNLPIMMHAVRASLPYMLLACVLALGFIGTLALFVSVKREMRRHAIRSRLGIEELTQKLEASPREAEAEPASLPVPQWRQNLSGMNMSRRVQAMRMVRRNQDASHIAAVLGVTRREVELLIRVQQASRHAA